MLEVFVPRIGALWGFGHFGFEKLRFLGGVEVLKVLLIPLWNILSGYTPLWTFAASRGY